MANHTEGEAAGSVVLGEFGLSPGSSLEPRARKFDFVYKILCRKSCRTRKNVIFLSCGRLLAPKSNSPTEYNGTFSHRAIASHPAYDDVIIRGVVID